MPGRPAAARARRARLSGVDGSFEKWCPRACARGRAGLRFLGQPRPAPMAPATLDCGHVSLRRARWRAARADARAGSRASRGLNGHRQEVGRSRACAPVRGHLDGGSRRAGTSGGAPARPRSPAGRDPQGERARSARGGRPGGVPAPPGGRRVTLAQAARVSGLSRDVVERLHGAMGLSSLALEELTEDDLRILRDCAAILAAGAAPGRARADPACLRPGHRPDRRRRGEAVPHVRPRAVDADGVPGTRDRRADARSRGGDCCRSRPLDGLAARPLPGPLRRAGHRRPHGVRARPARPAGRPAAGDRGVRRSGRLHAPGRRAWRRAGRERRRALRRERRGDAAEPTPA